MLLIRNLLDFINYMLIAAILSEFVQVLFQKRKNYNGISSTIMKVIRFLIYVVALAFFYTNVLEKDILPILATSSVILTVVGLAVRDVIFDFVAGIAISFDQTFKINHWVNFQSKDRRIDGMIEDLGWRNVIIRSKDDLKHVIPNSQIYAQIISNASITDGNRRVDATFFTNTHVSIDLIYQTVMECALETLKTIPGVPLEKPVRIIFERIHADGLQLKLQFFLRDKESGEQARSILLNAIHTRLASIHALPARMVQSQSSDMKPAQLMQTGAIDLELGKSADRQ